MILRQQMIKAIAIYYPSIFEEDGFIVLTFMQIRGIVRSWRIFWLAYEAVNHAPWVPAHTQFMLWLWQGRLKRMGSEAGYTLTAGALSIRKHRSQAGRRVYLQRKTCSRKVKGPRCHRTGKLGKSKRSSLSLSLYAYLHAQHSWCCVMSLCLLK